MGEARKENYRNVLRRASASIDARDPAAIETVYDRLRKANESLIQKNAGTLNPDQAKVLRQLLEDVIGEHRSQGLSGPSNPIPTVDRTDTKNADAVASLPKKQSARWLWPAGGAVALVLIGAAAFAYLSASWPHQVAISAIQFSEKPDIAASENTLKASDAPWNWTELPLLTLVDGMQSRVHMLTKDGDTYTITGDDPQLVYDLRELAAGGSDLPYLGFDFSCAGKSGDARIKVFWWGDDQNDPQPRPSALFEAREGKMMVPISASNSWVALKSLNGIRIDLEPGGACTSMTLGNVGFFGLSG